MKNVREGNEFILCQLLYKKDDVKIPLIDEFVGKWSVGLIFKRFD